MYQNTITSPCNSIAFSVAGTKRDAYIPYDVGVDASQETVNLARQEAYVIHFSFSLPLL